MRMTSLLSIALLTVYFRESAGGPLHRTQGVGAAILRPFEVGVERIARPFRDVYGYFAGLVHVKRENARLKAQVNELRQKALLGEAAQAQNVRLRAELNFIDSPRYPSDYSPVNTRIIGWRSKLAMRSVPSDGRTTRSAAIPSCCRTASRSTST